MSLESWNRSMWRSFGVRLTRSPPIRAKELPLSLTPAVAGRVAHFADLLARVRDVPGDVVECGVGWGRSLLMLSALVQAEGRGRTIHAFDSFEGFPEPTGPDLVTGRTPKAGHYRTTLDGVRRYLEASGLPRAFIEDHVRFYPGFFGETLGRYSGGPVALAHIDVDLYESYRETLAFFYPRVSPGGVVAFDEYHDVDKFPGARRAIDEFLDGREPIERSSWVERHFVVKSRKDPGGPTGRRELTPGIPRGSQIEFEERDT